MSSSFTRWRIEEAPSPKDPGRKKLMLKGALSDVHALIRRFGAICGRPKRTTDDPEFNYVLFLNQQDDGSLEKLRSELLRVAGAESAGGAAPAPRPSPAAFAPMALPDPPAQSIEPLELPTPPAAAIEPVSLPTPPAAAPISLPTPPAQAAAPVALPTPPEIPAAEEPMVDLSLESPAPAIAPLEIPAIAPSIEEEPRITLSTPGGLPPPPPGVTPTPRAAPSPTGPLFGAVKTPDPLLTVDAMITGGFNRFAHAAVMSVMSSPGAMYNPLFICGPAGTGKTHMLSGLAQKYTEQSPGNPVAWTSGARLAQAATAAAKSGKAAEFESFASEARALVIDDLHLMGVNEQNREVLAKFFAAFYAANKQVVAASVYSAQLLAGVDQAVGLNLAAGHPVDLKMPGEEAMKEIATSVLERMGLAAGDAVDMFLQRAVSDYPRLAVNARRMRRMAAAQKAAGKNLDMRELVGYVYGAPMPATDIPADELKLGLPAKPAAGGEGPVAILIPPGAEIHGDYAWNQLAGAAQKRGWAFPYKSAGRRPYAVDPAYGAPFSAASEAMASRAKAVLVVGPASGSELAAHEADFLYALEHLMADADLPLAYMPHGRMRDESAHAGALLDILEAE